ncbi:radical SAM protein [bacterium]|nr:radical SAM protein [bacterium]MBU1994481.1 radical SAM protein [bacterium]
MTGTNKNIDFHNNLLEFTEYAYEHEDVLPHRYVFVLTNRCNLKCSFCFQEKKVMNSNMKFEDWVNLLEQIPQNARVTLTGGEPLIFPNFRELFKIVASKAHCNIISNGLLLSYELIDEMLKYDNFKVLSISIDNITNSIRDVSPKEWSELEEKLRYFVKKRDALKSSCVLDIKTTILDENAKDLFEIYRYCVEDLGCDTHGFQFLKGSYLQHSDKIYDADKMYEKSHAYVYGEFAEIKKQLKQIQEYNQAKKKKSFLHPKVGSLIQEDSLAQLDCINEEAMNYKDFKPCKFPWSSVHINYDGNLCPCMAISMGNVKEMRLEEIIFGKAFGAFKSVIKKEGLVEGCNRCGWLKPKNEVKD